MYSAVTTEAAAKRGANHSNIWVGPKFGSNKLAITLAVAVLSAWLMAARPASAQTMTDIYDQPEYGDPYGTGSLANLVADGAGNFYGTTNNGGIDEGSVFKVSPNGSGGWNGTTLYSFTGGADGGGPGYGALIFDHSGNLYGTTMAGGANGYGTVFELTPTGSSWTETVLYSFTGGTYNATPINGLITDSSGNLYGTTYPRTGTGAVFELSLSGGVWTEQLIYACPQGNYAGQTMDPAGNIYGIGSVGDHPTVYELSQNLQGEWAAATLYTFPAFKAGTGPEGTLALDKEGNIYGTTVGTGKLKSFGTVFELRPPLTRTKGAEWRKKVLYAFKGEANGDGANPFAGVTLDKDGDVFGTTLAGGLYSYGTAYDLFNFFDGSYGEAILASVADAGGITPYGGVILDSAGNVYGTTAYGGTYNLGIVYEVTNN
jgi:uncharacterized repeat protein (TIGR03803 family)